MGVHGRAAHKATARVGTLQRDETLHWVGQATGRVRADLHCDIPPLRARLRASKQQSDVEQEGQTEMS